MASGKRADYISWEDFYMGAAVLAAKRSKDPHTQVGACIVNKDKKIVGIGYNGMPTGCSDDDLSWKRGENLKLLDSKHAYVCHAEMNAVIHRNSADLKGCTIYVTLFPCNECAKIIIQSGIEEVVYCSDKYAKRDVYKASKILLDKAGVKYVNFKPNDPWPITLNFPVSDTQALAPEGLSSTDPQSSQKTAE